MSNKALLVVALAALFLSSALDFLAIENLRGRIAALEAASPPTPGALE